MVTDESSNLEAITALRVRPYEAADLDAVAELWTVCDLVRSYNPPARDIALCRDTPTSELFVADADGRIVGTIMVGSDGHRGWLYYLAVAPDCRNRGYGRRLVRRAETWLAGHGIRKVQLMIRETNLDVRRFYESVGYEDNPCPVMQRWLVDPHAP